LPNEYVDRLRSFYQDRHVCVTGGAGFIGGHLVDALLSLGARISIIDDLSNSRADHLAGLIDLEPDRVRLTHGSILHDASLSEAMDQAQTVFHLAAMSSVPRSVLEPERSYSINAFGTLRVLEAARAIGAERIVYSASSSAYGANASLPKRERDLPEPLSPYAAGKLAGEHLMQAWSRSYELSTVSLRYFNIFGPRQPADSPYSGVIALFARRLLADEPVEIFGDGEQSRDFTFVTNAVLANLLAGASAAALRGEVANIGSGQRVTLLDLYALIATACGAPHRAPKHAPDRVGDVRHSLAELSTAKELLGYSPVVDLPAGLQQTVDWYKGAYAADTRTHP
jgi:UDP-glucose 4-epimerase